MKILRLSIALLAGTCLWAGYQFSYTDGLTSIDPSKWTQTGSLSIGSAGLTGNGALISTVTVPTGNDYDVRMTIHTANQGPCTGSYSLYARSTPDNTTSYALTINAGTVGLFKKVAGSWTLLSWLPYSCSDGTAMRLVAHGSALTFWSGPHTATYQDASPIAGGHPGVGISSSAGDAIGNVQIGPIGYLAPAAIAAPAIETSTTANRVDLRWPASAADTNSAGLQGYVVYRDGVYLGSPLTPSWLDQTVTGGWPSAIYVVDSQWAQNEKQPVPFETDQKSWDALVRVVRREGDAHHREEIWVTVEGELRAPPRYVREDGQVTGAYGFSMFPAEVIVKRFVATTIKPDPTYDYSELVGHARAR